MPDDQAEEKRDLLRKLGAQVHVTACCSIANKDHYVNCARRLAEEIESSGGKAIFMDQFENTANYAAHFEGTGPEIWEQMEQQYSVEQPGSRSRSSRRLDAFVMSAGTGGTIAGVSR